MNTKTLLLSIALVGDALARAASPGPPPLLYDTKAGHAGGRPIGKLVDDPWNR